MQLIKDWAAKSLIGVSIFFVCWGYTDAISQIDSTKKEMMKELDVLKEDTKEQLAKKTNKETQELQNAIIIKLLEDLTLQVKEVQRDTKTIKKRSN